ncbi:MAG: hypothetical protein M3N14_10205 [Bacteroidota bacterium]|nr:hypothetical protein [Bacteroidota bacterium]
MKITSTVLYFILFTVMIAVPPLALQYTGNNSWLAAGFWATFIFMAVLTILLLTGMLAVKQKNQEYFTQAFLAATTFKILACLVYIFVFLRKNAVDKHVFLADFVYIYLLNTAFEIYVLLRNLRHENSR